MNRCPVFSATLTKPATDARNSRNLAQMAKEADLEIQRKPAKSKRMLASLGHVEVHVPEVPARAPSPVSAASEAEAPPSTVRASAGHFRDFLGWDNVAVSREGKVGGSALVRVATNAS